MTIRRIEPVPGYTPTIGRLVCILTHSRQALIATVAGLSREQLDHLHDPESNTIGALLTHVAAVERWYQVFTFENRMPSAGEDAAWSAALNLGDRGRQELKGRELQGYVDDLATIREGTLAALAERDDVWLEAPLRVAPEMNPHFAWFHVAEDEINHRGQIRWLRARLRTGEGR